MQNRPTCVRACTNRGLGEWKWHKQCCLYPRPEKTGALSSQIAGSISVTPNHGGWNENHIFPRNEDSVSDTPTDSKGSGGRSTMKKGRGLLWPAMEGQTTPATNNASNLKLSESKHSERADVGNTERFHCSPSLLTSCLGLWTVPATGYPEGDGCCTPTTSHVHLSPAALQEHWTRPASSSLGFCNTFLHLFVVVIVTKLYLKASNRKLLLGKLRFKHSVANNELER